MNKPFRIARLSRDHRDRNSVKELQSFEKFLGPSAHEDEFGIDDGYILWGWTDNTPEEVTDEIFSYNGGWSDNSGFVNVDYLLHFIDEGEVGMEFKDLADYREKMAKANKIRKEEDEDYDE